MVDSTQDEIDHAANAAAAAAPGWAASTLAQRAQLLQHLALALEEQRTALVALADEESFLGATRLGGEMDRTCFQLRAFASFCWGGAPFHTTDDLAIALPAPQGRPRLTRVRVPLGPVAMFSASNFPFAFSVLGGDTASALAAGCPVVVKGHAAHARLSRAVHALALGVLEQLGLPPGLIGHVQGPSPEVGTRLVRHPAIQAVAFTGSIRGGLALQALASAREPPVPFFGELGSVNPVIVLPGVLPARNDELAAQLAASVAQGSGQFCTSPGIVALVNDDHAQPFIDALAVRLDAAPLHRMLSPAIATGFAAGARERARLPGVHFRPMSARAADVPQPLMVVAGAAAFLATPLLHEELFGPAITVVLCEDQAQLATVLHAIPGSLTVTLWGADNPSPLAQTLACAAMKRAGRVLFGGMPTGVAVTGAQHHGGPWPASTQPASTSVGLAACDRFLRPVALQDAPPWLLARGGQPLG
jgi:NADP-dependent aldehyde dehydrogenase